MTSGYRTNYDQKKRKFIFESLICILLLLVRHRADTLRKHFCQNQFLDLHFNILFFHLKYDIIDDNAKFDGIFVYITIEFTNS